MALRTKSLDQMNREIIASLEAGARRRPAFALIVGSGFSFPIIPTPTQMLRGDIAWWRYCKANQLPEPFGDPADVIAAGHATQAMIAQYEKQMWKEVHDHAASSQNTVFMLGDDGLPALADPESIGRAYQAIMCDGLVTNRMRRQYLRDAIGRSHPKVNGAHIFLASILEAQESWGWGAPFCRTIFTTNFDPLLQRSLQLVNKLYYMTDRPDVLEPPDDDESEAIHLVYTHGSVHRYELLNTGDQIDHARKRNAPALVDYFRRHGVIVIGYSGWRDTTMEALQSCSSFDSNLYWCDIHSAADAMARLRPEVLRILEAPEKNAYYVPIPSADEAMRQLHRDLRLGDVPNFILAPVATMIEQLRSIEVPNETTTASQSGTKRLSDSLATLLAGTLTRLEVAKSAFDDPSIVHAVSDETAAEVAEALVARLMSDAEVASSGGKLDEAIALWNSVISTEKVTPANRASALFSRGVAYARRGHIDEAIHDYSALLEIKNAPVRHRGLALYNRAFLEEKSGAMADAISDYSAVIALAGVPPSDKAGALLNRGLIYASRGENQLALDDYSAVLKITEALADTRAKALRNRGLEYEKMGELAKSRADYDAVVAMHNTSAVQKAIALMTRGVMSARNGQHLEAIDDYKTVIAMPDAPAEQKAEAFLNRGLAWAAVDERTRAIRDYESVITMSDAPAEIKASAYTARGWGLYLMGDVDSMIEDSREAIELDAHVPGAQGNLALGLLLKGYAFAAEQEYDKLLAMNSTSSTLQEAVDDLTAVLTKRPELPEGPRLLDKLKAVVETAPE